DRGSDPAPADHDSPVGLVFDNGHPDGLREIGIIHRFGSIRTDIQNRAIPLPQERGNLLLQLESGMVGPQNNPHDMTSLATIRRVKSIHTILPLYTAGGEGNRAGGILWE